MGGIRLEGDIKGLQQNLHKLSRISFQGLHKEIGEAIVASTQNRFRTQMAPDGTRWQRSARAAEAGGQTLSKTRRLRNSINYRATPRRVEVGTNLIYASVHQNGMTIKAKRSRYLKFRIGNQFVQVKQVNIPARPFMGLSDADNEEINQIIKDRFDEVLK